MQMRRKQRQWTGSARARLAFVLALTIGTASCSQDLTGTGTSSNAGPVTVAITDGASDSIESFQIEVTSIQLHKVSGADVSVLSAPVNVDLASLTDTSLLLTSLDVPAGLYTRATLTLDLSSAVCVLTGKTTPATILDSSGAAVTGTLSVPLQLGTAFQVAVTAHRLLEFDFDLDQSFTVDTVGNTVSFEPAFVLRVDPATPKEIVTIGTLTSVDTVASTFLAAVHAVGGAVVSNVIFRANGATQFQVNGVPTTGAQGLAALSALPANASIQCRGALALSSGEVTVESVEAGTGTFDGGQDIVEGHIVGRTGGIGSDAVLQVLGHSIDANHTTFQYATTFLVNTTFANTKVVRRESSTVFDVDDLNVGQRVRVFGTLSGTTMSAVGTTDVIRMQPTRVFGAAAGARTGTTLTLDIARVGLLAETDFDWNDGGATPVDPDAFEADVGALGVGLGITSVSLVSVEGYFTGIGASGVDFVATALTNQSSAPSLLFVRNRIAVGFNVLVTANASQIQLNVTGTAAAGETAIIDRGLIGSIALPTAPTPTVNHPSVNGFYSLRDRTTHSVRVFTRFSDFSSALQSDIVQGATLVQLGAVGNYSAVINTIDASVATAVVE